MIRRTQMRIRSLSRISGACIVGGMLLVLLLTSVGTAQKLYVSGGSNWSQPVGSDTVWNRSLSYQLMGRFNYTDYLQLQGGVNYNGALSVEGSVVLRPLDDTAVSPYLFAGYGRYIASVDRRSVIPAGGGIEYQITPQTGIYVEVDRRWTSFRGDGITEERGWTPRAGLSYRFSPPQPPPPPTPPVATEPEPESEDTLEAGRFGGVRFDPNKYPDMELVPDGMFTMGLTEEDPLNQQTAGRKRITVNAFYIDKYEVSNEEYRAWLNQLPADQREEMLPDSTVWTEARSQENWRAYFEGELFADYPVIGVNWNEAQAYCRAQGKHLPTEAEWEYAARAGHIGRIYPWPGFEVRTDSGSFRANYKDEQGGYAADGFAYTAPVKAFPPNDWGIHNMAGNVAEWVRDAYTPSYEELSDFNPLYQDSEEPRRVIRGGSWASSAFYIGAGVRNAMPRSHTAATLGFRCIRHVTATEQFGGSAPATPPAGQEPDQQPAQQDGQPGQAAQQPGQAAPNEGQDQEN